jgi:hypothetical protein
LRPPRGIGVVGVSPSFALSYFQTSKQKSIMENQISLDLITVTDPAILRSIRFVRKQNYSDDALKKDAARDTPLGLKDSKVCIFAIGNKTFNADHNDEISKIIIENRQSELYSISFTEGQEYKNSQGQMIKGINFSTHLTKAQRKADITFEQDLLIEASRAELSIMEQKARIAKSYGEVNDVVRLQTDNVL